MKTKGRAVSEREYEVFGCWVSILLLGFMFFDLVGFYSFYSNIKLSNYYYFLKFDIKKC